MLYRLGKIISKSSINSSLIFESNYTGYVINVNNVDNFEIDKFQKIFIFDYKHDYEKTYYGFKEFMERVLFKDLLSIQGLRPKTAMSVLSFDWKRSSKYDCKWWL